MRKRSPLTPLNFYPRKSSSVKVDRNKRYISPFARHNSTHCLQLAKMAVKRNSIATVCLTANGRSDSHVYDDVRRRGLNAGRGLAGAMLVTVTSLMHWREAASDGVYGN